MTGSNQTLVGRGRNSWLVRRSIPDCSALQSFVLDRFDQWYALNAI